MPPKRLREEEQPGQQELSQASLIEGPSVTILVGEAVFHMPKNLVCHFSEYFQKVFNSTLTEGREQRVQLEHAGSEVFGIIAQWMYSGGKVDIRTVVGYQWGDTSEDGFHTVCERLCNVYYLSDYLMIPQLLKDLTEELLWLPHTYKGAVPVCPALVTNVFENTANGSELRKVFKIFMAYNFYGEGGDAVKFYRDLFRQYPELALEMIGIGFAAAAKLKKKMVESGRDYCDRLGREDCIMSSVSDQSS